MNSRLSSLLLTVIGLLLLLPGSDSLPLIDRDEPRFVQATREMVERDDWVIPTFNTAYRFDKPPLTYWWMRLNFMVFGDNELGARMHSILSSIGVALLIAAWGYRSFGVRAGFLAGLGWLTCFQLLIHGRLAVADMPMILFLTAAQWVTWRAIAQREDLSLKRLRFWVLYGSLALAFLAKGPLPVIIWAMTLIGYRWVLCRHRAVLPNMQWIAGTIVFLVGIGAWGIPALVQTQGAFWDVGMGTHVIERGTGAFNGRVPLPFYYLITAGFSLFPWVFLLPTFYRRTAYDFTPERAFLVAWLVAPFLIFSFYATQLPHYTLPGFPAFFILLFSSSERFDQKAWSLRAPLYLYGLFWLLIAGLLAFGIVQAVARQDLMFGLLFVSLLGLIASLTLLFAAYLKNRTGTLGMAAAAVAAGLSLAGVGHSMRTLSVTWQLAPILQNSRADHFVGYEFSEPGLVYYSGHYWDFPHDAEGWRAVFERSGSTLGVTRVAELSAEDALKQAVGRPPKDIVEDAEAAPYGAAARLVAEISGINFARMSWVTVRVYQSR